MGDVSTRPYHTDHVYLDSLEEVLSRGVKRADRTGVGTISLFGAQERYDLTKGFPLLTSKKVYTRGVFNELLFFLLGRTDNQWLNERKTRIWDEWAGDDGDLGPIYGYQWRFFGAEYISQKERDSGVHPIGGVDQLKNLLTGLKNDPFSRRHIISAWSPKQLEDMALPPCHTLFQFYVTPDSEGKPFGLSCKLTQRSADLFLGVPFNIASYAALTHLIADLVGLTPLEFVHSKGDGHIYLNHLEQVEEQLSRREALPSMPTLTIDHPVDLNLVSFEDLSFLNEYSSNSFRVEGYSPLPTIKAEVAV